LDRDGTNPWDATGAVGGWENSNIWGSKHKAIAMAPIKWL
jgi:hypothetical protein